MGLDIIGTLPGKKDINNQFTVGANIHKALACFKRIQNNGTYDFGALTACFYNLPPGEKQSWMDEVKIYPPAAQDAIKNCIIQALTHKDKDGKDDPIPLTMIWSGGSNNEVKCTYTPSPPSYTIEIIGYLPPWRRPSPNGKRRNKKSHINCAPGKKRRCGWARTQTVLGARCAIQRHGAPIKASR